MNISIASSLWECSLYSTSPNLFASRTTCALHCKLLVSLLVQQLLILAFPFFVLNYYTVSRVRNNRAFHYMQCVQAGTNLSLKVLLSMTKGLSINDILIIQYAWKGAYVKILWLRMGLHKKVI